MICIPGVLFMRTIISFLWILVYLIITIPAMLYMGVTHKKDPWKAEKTARFWMTILFDGLIFIAGTKVSIRGLENVPKDRAVVYVGNHRSYFDIILTYKYCNTPTSYIAKSDLQGIPFFGFWGKMMMVLFFDQKDIKASLKMILEGIERLKSGKSVFIFPEGGRNKEPELIPLREFHDGSFKLASKSGAPVIPVALKKTDDIWEAHFPWVKKAAVTITYGEPVSFSTLSAEDKKRPGNYFKNLIETMLQES